MSVFTITTEKFEGPIELLLNLIKERKLPINEISLAKITDDYLRMMREATSRSYDEATQFMIIAATLVLIKSHSLLPTLELTDEEQENIADLERRLKMLELYKEMGESMNERYGKQRLYGRSTVPMSVVFAPDASVTAENLLATIEQVLHEISEFTAKQLPEKRITAIMHIEEMMDHLIARVTEAMKTSFHEFAHGVSKTKSSSPEQHKAHIVVGFLAMLEMVRNGIIAVEQEETFQDIMMTKN